MLRDGVKPAEMFEHIAVTDIGHAADILRILTIFSVVLLPLTLITGVFGMNFGHIPFSREYHGFLITVAVMLVMAGGLLSFVRWKRWI